MIILFYGKSAVWHCRITCFVDDNSFNISWFLYNYPENLFASLYSKLLDCEDCHRLAYVFDDVSAWRQFFDDGEEIAGVQFPLVKVWVLWVLAQQQRVNALYLQQTTFIFYNCIKTMPVSARYKYDMEKIWSLRFLQNNVIVWYGCFHDILLLNTFQARIQQWDVRGMINCVCVWGGGGIWILSSFILFEFNKSLHNTPYTS